MTFDDVAGAARVAGAIGRRAAAAGRRAEAGESDQSDKVAAGAAELELTALATDRGSMMAERSPKRKKKRMHLRHAIV